MPKDLERDLGLVAVVAISMGAMIGSGIFILPGLAMAEAGDLAPDPCPVERGRIEVPTDPGLAGDAFDDLV